MSKNQKAKRRRRIAIARRYGPGGAAPDFLLKPEALLDRLRRRRQRWVRRFEWPVRHDR